MKEDKPLKDCFKCCVCLDAAGFMPNWAHYTPRDTDEKNNITYPLLCKRCDRAFTAWRGKENRAMLDVLDWVAKRARAAENRRMADKLNVANYKLEILQRQVRTGVYKQHERTEAP